jgi:hypothetical protein
MVAMVLVFNLTALAVLAVSVGGAFAGHFAGLADGEAVALGFAVMTLAGVALELHPKAAWRPRFFWVVPAWFAGAMIGGGVLVDQDHAVPGAIALAGGGAAAAALVVRAIVAKPGGKWMAGLVGALAIVTGFQLIGYYRPEWKHPVLYAVNAIALIAAIACGVMVYRARSQGASSRTNSTTR